MQLNNTTKISLEQFRIDLRQFERSIERINQSTCCLGINIPQCHTIMEIGLASTLSVNALAEKMNVDKSTVSRQVEKLVKSELVHRITTTEDRRRVSISLSPKGASIYQQMNDSMNEQFRAAFQKIDAQELATFLKVFKIISHTL